MLVLPVALLCFAWSKSISVIIFLFIRIFTTNSAQFPFLSCLVLSCLVLSCLVLSCLVLSCLVLSCLVLSCLVLSCPVLSCLVLSCLLSSQITSHHVASHHVTSLHITFVCKFLSKPPFYVSIYLTCFSVIGTNIFERIHIA